MQVMNMMDLKTRRLCIMLKEIEVNEWNQNLVWHFPYFFVPIIHQKIKKQFVGLLIKKKVFEAIKIKKKRKKKKDWSNQMLQQN